MSSPSGAPAPPWRLALVLALAVVWLLPWADTLSPTTGATQTQRGAERTGMAGLSALLVLWGLLLTTHMARTRRGVLAGEAFTHALLAGLVTLLLALEHPWLAAGERAAAWLPVFAPLALLAALDGATRLSSARTGCEITAVRVGAGLFAAASLAAGKAWLPAALAAWIAGAPLVFLAGRSRAAAGRALEGLLVGGALGAGFAPALQRLLVRMPDAIGGMRPTAIAWSVLAAIVVLNACSGLLAPSEPAPSR